MRSLTQQHTQRLELRFEKSTFGQKAWHARYNYPRLAFSYTHYSLNNTHHIGSARAFSPGFTFDLMKRQRLSFSLGTQVGLGRIEKPFHPIDNYQNIAIGSEINFYFFLQSTLQYQLHRSWVIGLGASFSHFSNNAFKVPNLGFNLPHAQVGISHLFGSQKRLQERKEFKIDSAAYWSFRIAGGLNESFPIGGPKHLATNWSINRAKRINPTSSIGGGLDFFYNPAQRASLAVDSIFIDKGIENLQLGLSVFHHLHFGKFGVWTQVGAYLRTQQEDWGRTYQLIKGSYALDPHWMILAGLKTHQATAEYFMLGFQFSIRK
jgi:hypothetical protein